MSEIRNDKYLTNSLICAAESLSKLFPFAYTKLIKYVMYMQTLN